MQNILKGLNEKIQFIDTFINHISLHNHINHNQQSPVYHSFVFKICPKNPPILMMRKYNILWQIFCIQHNGHAMTCQPFRGNSWAFASPPRPPPCPVLPLSSIFVLFANIAPVPLANQPFIQEFQAQKNKIDSLLFLNSRFD